MPHGISGKLLLSIQGVEVTEWVVRCKGWHATDYMVPLTCCKKQTTA